MDEKLMFVVQGLAGVACIVLAAVFLADEKTLVQFGLVSNFGATLLGNLVKGPGQLTRAEHERIVQQMKVPSVPPPPIGR